MLALIHGTHLGIVKCKQRAREALYWAGMSAQIEDKVKDCTVCHNYAPAQQKQPLMPSPVSDLPWAMAASDIFAFEGHHYLVLVDYYSKYIEVTKLNDLTSQDTIEALRRQRHPEKPRLVPHAVSPPMSDTRMEKLPLDYQSDQSVTRKSPARKIPPSPEVAATRGSTLYTTRSGRQVKKPIKLDL